jgi:4'-phosphopantetheinyl transferase
MKSATLGHTLPAREAEWEAPTVPPNLAADEIHVWRSHLVRNASDRAAFASCLSPDERARASRIHFARDRDRFIVARGTLRTLLSYYVNVPPVALRFFYGQYGKPFLERERHKQNVSFNVSHSCDLALYAISLNRDVGIDVESVSPDFVNAEMARQCFSRVELRSFWSVPSELRMEAFFNGCTRKEAYIKALGMGLSIALDSFDVTLSPHDRACFLRGIDQQWQLVSFRAEAGFPAALVHNRAPCRVRFFARDLPQVSSSCALF